jgi:hypothetical protein
MGGVIPPLHLYIFMAWCLAMHKNKFTFTFITGYYRHYMQGAEVDLNGSSRMLEYTA